jgi:hypothetical protein
MTRKIETSIVQKAQYINYWIKAIELKEMMLEGIVQRRWNAASVAAVHAVICANDAIMVYLFGIKSTSKNHSDAVKLLRDRAKQKGVDEAAKHLSKVLYSKNMIEYESRLFTQSEAYVIVKHTEKYMEWAMNILP